MKGCFQRPVNCIVPPDVLRHLAKQESQRLRELAQKTLLSTAELRGERNVRSLLAATAPADTARRTIFDCGNEEVTAGAKRVRGENDSVVGDASVNRAFDGLGVTRDFYLHVFRRNSLDDRGMRLNGYVHYGEEYQNAFWDGQVMVFGDGDGEVFIDFTNSLDVIAHELTHAVTQFTAGLQYRSQPGALNESMSDVFGSLVKQWKRGESTSSADWLIGAEILTPAVANDALRSMKAPGTAYDNALMGKDPQPDHMKGYVPLPENRANDWGGVHRYSGIPNKAFYETAFAIGGNAWDEPGHIWYESLKASSPTTNFAEFASTTYSKAGQLYGSGSVSQKAVAHGWEVVGIRVGETRVRGPVRSWAGEESRAELASTLRLLQEKLDSIKASLPSERHE
jgi:Zn-dependent metalloprotease